MNESSNSTVQAAGIPRLEAAKIGIAIDGRRQNMSEESLAANVERLKAYKARLIILPRKSNKVKKGETKAEEVAKMSTSRTVAGALPVIRAAPGVTEIKKGDMPKAVEGGAYRKLRTVRSDARLVGVREKRAKEKADAEAAKK
jgi:large subunit ribosomal protein L13e